MKTKLLAIFLLAAGSAFAGHVSVGVAIGVGGGYGYGYYAAPRLLGSARLWLARVP
jgi:hypothetical protein